MKALRKLLTAIAVIVVLAPMPGRTAPASSFTEEEQTVLMVAALVRIYMQNCPTFAQTGLPRTVLDRIRVLENRHGEATLARLTMLVKEQALRDGVNSFCGRFVTSIRDLPLMLSLTN